VEARDYLPNRVVPPKGAVCSVCVRVTIDHFFLAAAAAFFFTP
jgi:hypothetical protein